MHKKSVRLLALTLSLLPATVWALGLGSIETHSALNEPFHAEIPLISASGQELQSIHASLAGRKAYQQAGLDYVGALDRLQFKVVKTPHGPVIRITSEKPIREPLLSLLVDVHWAQGQIEREYDVLLDPATLMKRESRPAPRSATVAAAPQPAPAPSANASPSPRPAPHPVPRSYRVKPRDTLWGIASDLRRDDAVTTNQMMVALYRRNPDAFQGNMNLLKRGAVLRVPSRSRVTSIGRHEAFQEVRRQHRAWVAAKTRAASGPPAAGGGTRHARLELVAPRSGQGGGAPVTRQAQSQGKGSTTSSAGELAALQGQVKQLQQQVQKLQHVMTVRNNELAQLQAELQQQRNNARKAATGAAAPAQAAVGQTHAAQPGAAPPAGGTHAPTQPQPQATKPAAAQTASRPGKAGAAAGKKVGVTRTAQAGAGQAPAHPAPAKGTAHKSAPPAAHKPAHPAPAQEAAPPSLPDRVIAVLGGIGQALRNPLALAGVVGLPLLLGLLVFVRRRREAAEAEESLGAGGLGSFDVEDEGLPAHDSDTGSLSVVSDTGPVDEAPGDATVQLSRGEAAPYVAGDEGETGGAAGLKEEAGQEGDLEVEVQDPVSEVDFHLAYGLYDEALGIVDRAIEREPTRRDFKLKKLEVLFAAGRSAAFLEGARALADEPRGRSDSNWDKVAIMGRQLLPDEALFSAEGAGPGEYEDDFLDIDLPGDDSPGDDGDQDRSTRSRDAGDTEEEDFALDDLLAGEGDGSEGVSHAGTTEEPRSGLGEDAGEEARPDRDAGVDTSTYELDDAAGQARSWDAGDDQGLTFDLDEKDMPSGSGDATEMSGEGSGAPAGDEALEFDLGGAWDSERGFGTAPAGSAPEPDTPTEHGTEGGSGAAETGLDFELDELDVDPGQGLHVEESEGPVPGSGDAGMPDQPPGRAAGAGAAPEEGQVTADAGIDEDQVATKLDLAEAYLGMDDSEGAQALLEEVLGEGTPAQRERAREMLRQIGGTEGDAAAPDESSAMPGRSPNPAETPDLSEGEPVGYGDDVGTKLDLARAYMGMDDAAAARKMLNEVLEEADEAQRHEAQALLDELA